MKPNQTALCGVALSLAVALYLVVRRSKHANVGGMGGAPVVSVFYKDEALEAARIASEQEFPDGSLVKVHSHGTGRVVHYIPPSKSYKVELTDPHGATQHKTVPAIHISHIKIKDLYVYPVKSCRGIRLEHAAITARGIANDRLWMFVDHKGKFVTMRRYPKMALITPQLDDLENPTVLTLTAPGMEDLRVPVLLEGQGEEVDTQVWGSETVGIHQGYAAAKWINKFLEDVREDREFTLVRMKDSVKRPTSAKFAPYHETGFADGYPFLLAVDASVTDVNEKLEEKITMDRFRPNIIVTGAPGFADEHWGCLTIGGLRFRNVKPCDRCSVPTVDPETGVAHPNREPQKTMTPFRNGVALGFKNANDKGYYFGSNLVAEDLGRLSVGAPVKVLTTKDVVFAKVI